MAKQFINPQAFAIQLPGPKGQGMVHVDSIQGEGKFNGNFVLEGDWWERFHKDSGGALITREEYDAAQGKAADEDLEKQVEATNAAHQKAGIATPVREPARKTVGRPLTGGPEKGEDR